MAESIFIVLIIFGTIFGIVYVAVSSRTRVRLALIEKGADASIFKTASIKRSNILPIVLVNLALLLMAVGVGIFTGAILHRSFNVDPDVSYPGSILIIAGLGLFIGYRLSSKLVKE